MSSSVSVSVLNSERGLTRWRRIGVVSLVLIGFIWTAWLSWFDRGRADHEDSLRFIEEVESLQADIVEMKSEINAIGGGNLTFADQQRLHLVVDSSAELLSSIGSIRLPSIQWDKASTSARSAFHDDLRNALAKVRSFKPQNATSHDIGVLRDSIDAADSANHSILGLSLSQVMKYERSFFRLNQFASLGVLIVTIGVGLLLLFVTHLTRQHTRRALWEAETTARTATRAASLLEATLALTRSEMNPQNIVSQAAELFVTLDSWWLGHVVTKDEKGNWVSDGRWYSADTNAAKQFQKITEAMEFEPGFDIVGEAIESRDCIWEEDYSSLLQSQRARLCPGLDLKTALAIPVVAGGRVRAIIEVFDIRKRPLDHALLESARHVSAQLGFAFDRADQFKLIDAQAQELRQQQAELRMHQDLLETQQISLQEQIEELEQSRMELEQKEAALNETEIKLSVTSQMAQNARNLHEFAARRFEELFDGVPVACFTTDADGFAYEWNRSAEELWGYASFSVAQAKVLELIANGETLDVLRDLLDRALQGEVIDQLEIETIDHRSKSIWTMASVFPLRGPDGMVTGAVWAFSDITLRKLQDDRVRESELRLNSSLDAMQSGVLHVAPDGTITRANPRSVEILGLDIPHFELVGVPVSNWTMFNEDNEALSLEEFPVSRSLKEGMTIRDQIVGVDLPTGNRVWLSVNSAPIKDSKGIVGAVVCFVDVTLQLANEQTILQSMEQIKEYSRELEDRQQELAAANEQLQSMARTDGLTGVKNYRAFQEHLDAQFKQSRRYGDGLSMILLDVDHFKQFNDQFGHPAGDEVLKMVASTVRSSARDADFVARYGGEEFVVVLHNTDEKGTIEAMERIRKAIEIVEWPYRQVTVSLGGAVLTDEIESTLELVELADDALYESKEAGRNRSTLSDSKKLAA